MCGRFVGPIVPFNLPFMKSPQDLYQKALGLFKERRIEEASKLLEEAVSLDERYADALEALGVMYHRLNRLDEAIAAFKRLSKVEPDSIMAHTNLSQIYVAQGKISEAEAEQNEARRLTWKLQLKERRDERPAVSVEEQIQKFKKIIDLDPNDVLGYFSLGRVYAEAGRWEEASAAFSKALEVDGEHSSSYLGLGQALQEQGEFDQAARVFEKGIPVAERRGDMIPFKKMSARLNEIRSRKKPGD